MNIDLIIFLLALLTLPTITTGVIGKIKARTQNRVGAPILQPLFNLIKLLRKSETISEDCSWLFRSSTLINLATVILLAFLVPWFPFRSQIPGDDIFLVIYLFALIRFFTIIAALDAGSPFGALGASREATLSLLIEPAIILSLVALGLSAQTSDLGQVFALPTAHQLIDVPVWLLAGAGLFLASLVELSRMPIDDPTTHLELTMVHEAMVIENSGPNLALVGLSYNLRLVILYGVTAQCFIHALLLLVNLSHLEVILLSIALIFVFAIVTALIESFAVKLAWRKNPEFIAYALTMSLLAGIAAIVKGVIG